MYSQECSALFCRVWSKTVQETHSVLLFLLGLNEVSVQWRAEQLSPQVWLWPDPRVWSFLRMLCIPYLWNPTLQSCLRAHMAQAVKEASVPGPGHNLGIVGGQLELRALPSLPAGGTASPFKSPGPSFVTVDLIPSCSRGWEEYPMHSRLLWWRALTYLSKG